MINKLKNLVALSKERQFLLLLYKLSYDILQLLIISFVAELFLEAVLPGIVSQNNGFLITSFLIFAFIWSITALGEKLGINFKDNRKHHIFPFMLAGSFILIGNSLLKFSLLENLLITTLTLFVFFVFYHMIFPDKK